MDAVPLLVIVAAIFWAMMPDLPTPSRTTLPLQLVRISMTRSTWSRCKRPTALSIARASNRNNSAICSKYLLGIVRETLSDKLQFVAACASALDQDFGSRRQENTLNTRAQTSVC